MNSFSVKNTISSSTISIIYFDKSLSFVLWLNKNEISYVFYKLIAAFGMDWHVLTVRSEPVVRDSVEITRLGLDPIIKILFTKSHMNLK